MECRCQPPVVEERHGYLSMRCRMSLNLSLDLSIIPMCILRMVALPPRDRLIRVNGETGQGWQGYPS